MLRYVLRMPVTCAVIHEDSLTCPNCGTPCSAPRTPYCSEGCREMAGFVRQFRTGLIEGWIFEPEKQVALGQVLWHVLGGGRPLRTEIAPANAIKRAIAREDGRCQVCGAPATTVDHSGSGCNRPINLRAVCRACCEDRSFGDFQVTERETYQSTVEEISARIASQQPLRICDDTTTWDWRKYLAPRVHQVKIGNIKSGSSTPKSR